VFKIDQESEAVSRSAPNSLPRGERSHLPLCCARVQIVVDVTAPRTATINDFKVRANHTSVSQRLASLSSGCPSLHGLPLRCVRPRVHNERWQTDWATLLLELDAPQRDSVLQDGLRARQRLSSRCARRSHRLHSLQVPGSVHVVLCRGMIEAPLASRKSIQLSESRRRRRRRTQV
jgi:hypothetical protein